MLQSKGETVHETSKRHFAVYIGFFAGLLWGGIKIIEHYLHFTTLSPGFLIEPFFLHSFLSTWQGILTGWVAFIIFSIAAALIYSVMLAKARGPWYGLGYGLFWWAVIFLLFGPVTGTTKWIAYMDLNTVLTDFGLYLLWGLFIGYSITFEFTDERVREPFASGKHIPEPD